MSTLNRNSSDPMFARATRLAFFQGQRLSADDLNGLGDQITQLQFLHNRGLHGWGVALGFEAMGQAGDVQVTVNPGYALDSLGRNLLLSETLTLPVPAQAGSAQGTAVTYYLVAAYPDDSQVNVLERRAGDCGTDGAVRLSERALVYWTSQADGQGLEVILATARVRNCRLDAPLAIDHRRSARPSGQPYVAAGETSSPGTWSAWNEPGVGESLGASGVLAAVDTRLASFGSTPHYLGQLRGPRFFRRSALTPFLSGQDVIPDFLILDGSTFVVTPGRDGFEFRVLFADRLSLDLLSTDPGGLLALLNATWSVAWTGVEM